MPNGLDVTAEAQKLIERAYGQPRPVFTRSLDALHAASALVGLGALP